APRRQQDHRVQRTWRHGSRDADYQWTAVNRLMKFEGPYAPRVKAGCWRMHARGTARRSLWSFAPVLATDQRSLMSAVPRIVLQKSPRRSCGIEIRNNRIGANEFLNRCCAFTLDLESILRARMRKIVLQHNPSNSDQIGA